MKSLAAVLLLVALAVTLASCSTALEVSSQSSTPATPITDVSGVAILASLPADHYAEVGRIQLRWNGVRGERQVRNDPRIAQALRSEAAKLGGDAVIGLTFVPEIRSERDRVASDPSLVTGVDATAVRLHRAATPPPAG